VGAGTSVVTFEKACVVASYAAATSGPSSVFRFEVASTYVIHRIAAASAGL